MATFRVGFIGTGLKPEKAGPMGYGMAHQHVPGYRALEDCEIVACADIVEEHARAFAAAHGVPRIYTDHREMLAKEDLDIVSICTWPDQHAPLVISAALAGVRAIHCEKPMADTWAASRLMAQECQRRGVRLTFNHQRRFGLPFRKAKALIDEGAIGELQRIEFGAGDLYDYGSHNFDMANYFNNETTAEWVIAQIDYRIGNLIFGVHNENQAYALWKYRNGVYGMASTGLGSALVGSHHRVVGSEGVIELGPMGRGMPIMRMRRQGDSQWQAIDCEGETMHGPRYIDRAIADIVRALRENTTSELCARNALNATEQIFACWESARRRARVDLPLENLGNPLAEMVANEALTPVSR
jgi:UDP-N-acetylglucosamine 3-dehydrogenase